MRQAATSLLIVALATGMSVDGRAVPAIGTHLIAVLPLDATHAGGKLNADAEASLEEMLRDVATDFLANKGWTVLATQNMLQTLRDNGVDTEHCGEGDCPLAAARELKAEKFISSAVQWVEGDFTASIRLIDTATGSIISSERVEGKSVKELRKAFEAKASEFFAKAGMLNAGAPSSLALSAPSASVAEGAPAVQVTPPAGEPLTIPAASSTPAPQGKSNGPGKKTGGTNHFVLGLPFGLTANPTNGAFGLSIGWLYETEAWGLGINGLSVFCPQGSGSSFWGSSSFWGNMYEIDLYGNYFFMPGFWSPYVGLGLGYLGIFAETIS